jgi:hypothetical protein
MPFSIHPHMLRHACGFKLRWPRHAGLAALPRPQEHPAYDAILKKGADAWNKWCIESIKKVWRSGQSVVRVGVDADLRKADLAGAYLSGANLSGADLSGADLSRTNLDGASLDRAHLHAAHLCKADLNKADLSEADLSGADLTGASLQSATLVDTNLTGADLTGCRIYGVSAWGLILEGAKQQNLVVLVAALDDKIIKPAEIRFGELLARKAERMKGEHV